jgi:hypothetical protein
MTAQSEAKGPDASVACLGLGRAGVRGKRGFWAAHLCRITDSTRSQSGRSRAPAPSIVSLQSWRAADKPEPESMPRNRSPIGSLARAADCTSRLSGLPGRIGGAVRRETEPDACVAVGTAAAPAFGTEIGTAGKVAAETGRDALEAAGAPASAGAGPPAFSESKAANGGDGSAASAAEAALAEASGLARAASGERCRSSWVKIAFPPTPTTSAEMAAPTKIRAGTAIAQSITKSTAPRAACNSRRVLL